MVDSFQEIFIQVILKVLQVHNRYKLSGGEDVAVKAEAYLLKNNDNKADLFLVNNESINGAKAKIITAINVGYSRKYSKKLSRKIEDFRPDILHVHNFFALITPSVYDAAKNLGVPVIQTLHNYRIVCPGALLMRKGSVCEDCLTASAYKSVIYKCFRNSRVGSLAVANMVQIHRKRNTWGKKVDCYIALTEFSKQKFVQAGIPLERIQVKPNFIHPDPGVGDTNGHYALFAGRISREKGILTLLQAWKKIKNLPLKILGDGPLLDEVCKNGAYKKYTNIEFLGQQDRNIVFRFIKKAKFVVFPSEWYETFGLICTEAFACGKPVIVSRLGSMPEIVEDGVTGLHFEPGDSDDLVDKIQWLIDHPKECWRMGKNARNEFCTKYTAQKNYRMLMNVYEKVLSKG